jgi:hypothetical protein
MSTKRLRLLTLIGVILITAVIVAGVLLTYAGHDLRTVALPSPPDAAASPSGTVSDGLVRLNVTTDNVQDVIRTLHRPDSYSRNIKIEKFYATGSEASKAAVYNVGVSMYGGALSMQQTGAGDEKHIIITGGWMYIWYKEDKTYYRTSAQQAVYGEDAADEFQMIITYEDVLKAAREDILETGDAEYNGENCIYVRYRDGQLDYTTVCYISTASGLLTGAEQYDENMALVYRMTASDYIAGLPDLAAFDLPDGTNAVGNI